MSEPDDLLAINVPHVDVPPRLRRKRRRARRMPRWWPAITLSGKGFVLTRWDGQTKECVEPWGVPPEPEPIRHLTGWQLAAVCGAVVAAWVLCFWVGYAVWPVLP